MVIKGRSSDLLAVFSSLNKVVERKSTMPILSNFLIESKDGKAKVMSSDLTIEASTHIDAEGECSSTIPSDKLIQALTRFGDRDVVISNEDDIWMLKSGRANIKVEGMRGVDFPTIAADKSLGQVVLDAEVFASALKQVEKAASVQDIRYYLNGINFELKDKTLTMVGTNGHVMAVNKLDIEFDGDVSFIVPNKLVKILTTYTKGKITLDFVGKKHVTHLNVKVGGFEFTGALIDGKYPEWKRIVPDNDVVVEIESGVLLDALLITKITTNDKLSVVTVAASGGEIVFTSECLGNKSSDVVEAEVLNEMDSSFNTDYLIDALKSLAGIRVRFGHKTVEGKETPVSILPVDADYPIWVAMPYRM